MSKGSTAAMVAAGLQLSGKSQKEVADALGYERQNIVSMLKTGAMRVPIEKAPALARVLRLDPAKLLRTALLEYAGETLEALEEVHGRLPTQNEKEILKIIRERTVQADPPLQTLEQHQLLIAFCNALFTHRVQEPHTGDEDFGSWG